MITAENKYLSNLDILQNVNQPTYALLPTADKIYKIDVNTRKISEPDITILERDHKSSTLYFSIDRFIDYMDLAQTHCVIQYNVDGKTHFYPIPFYDIYTQSSEKKIIFPWNLSYSVTGKAGIVPFSIRFFKTGTRMVKENEIESILTYNLNILPSQLIIEKTLIETQISDKDEAYLKTGELEQLMDYIDLKMQTLSRKIYWTVLNDNYNNAIIDVTLQKQLLDIVQEEK